MRQTMFFLVCLSIPLTMSVASAESEGCFCRGSVNTTEIQPALDCLQLDTFTPAVCNGRQADFAVTNACEFPISVLAKKAGDTAAEDIVIAAGDTQSWSQFLEPTIAATGSDVRAFTWPITAENSTYTLTVKAAIDCQRTRSTSSNDDGCHQGFEDRFAGWIWALCFGLLFLVRRQFSRA